MIPISRVWLSPQHRGQPETPILIFAGNVWSLNCSSTIRANPIESWFPNLHISVPRHACTNLTHGAVSGFASGPSSPITFRTSSASRPTSAIRWPEVILRIGTLVLPPYCGDLLKVIRRYNPRRDPGNNRIPLPIPLENCPFRS